jgi:LCP family protein required for cell wall assembly
MSDTSKRRGRRTVARHGRLGAVNPFSRLLRVLGIGLACVLVAGVGVAGYAAWDLGSTFSENAVDIGRDGAPPPDVAQLVGEEGVDILLTGIDICEWDSHQKFGDRCPHYAEAYGEDGRQLESGLNDVNMLVHLSPEPRKLTVVAFPRDTIVPLPACTDPKTGETSQARDRAMLNEAYAAGGLSCVVETIDGLTTPHDPDLAIDYAATVTWNGVIEITNAIGGVDVCVAETIDDPEAGMLYLEGGQTHTLVGEQALAFLRARKTIGDGSDLARISNQQIYMSSLARKLTSSEVLTNPSTLLSLARTTLSNVDPSSNLTNPMTLVQVAMAAKDAPLSDIVFLQYPVIPDPYDPRNRVAPNEAEAAKLFAAISANESLAPDAPSETPGIDAGATTPPTETPGATEPPTLAQPDVTGRSAQDETCATG